MKVQQKVLSYFRAFTWKRAFSFSLTLHFVVLFVLLFSPIVKPTPRVINLNLLPPMQMVPVDSAPPKVEAPVKKSVLPLKEEIKEKGIVIPKNKLKKKKLKKKKIKKKITAAEKRKQLEKKLKSVDRQSEKKRQSQTPSGLVTSQYFPYQWYLVGLQNKITEVWQVPSHFARLDKLHVFVSFTVLRDGTVQNVKLKTSSGRQLFDQSALQAVREAQPFPALPPEYKEAALDVTIQFKLAE